VHVCVQTYVVLICAEIAGGLEKWTARKLLVIT
jgi:hypothetical protein